MGDQAGDWREPWLPEPFAFTSAILAAMGWTFIVGPIVFGIAGLGRAAGDAIPAESPPDVALEWFAARW
jgi:hypothetical protein